MHLGMSGSFRVEERPVGEFHHPRGGPVHDHVVFDFEGGARVVYNDPRRFGFMDLIATAALETHPLFAALGVEPLGPDFHAAALAAALAGSRAPLKAALLDQRRIAGLGNIYVCEALHARAAVAAARGGVAEARGDAAARQRPFRRCWRRRSRRAARPCAIIARPTGRSAISSTPSPSTTARAPSAATRAAAGSSCAKCRRPFDVLLRGLPKINTLRQFVLEKPSFTWRLRKRYIA